LLSSNNTGLEGILARVWILVESFEGTEAMEVGGSKYSSSWSRLIRRQPMIRTRNKQESDEGENRERGRRGCKEERGGRATSSDYA
jgi:hypothetical protein